MRRLSAPLLVIVCISFAVEPSSGGPREAHETVLMRAGDPAGSVPSLEVGPLPIPTNETEPSTEEHDSSIREAPSGFDGRLRQGWPQRIGNGAGYDWGISVVVADLDNNGTKEVIGCDVDGWVRVWNDVGEALPGWPYMATGTGGCGAAPACVDLDGDGDLEMILPIATTGIQAWHHDGTNVAGWPKAFSWPQRPWPSVTVGNLDSDPSLEIIGSVNDPLALYVWNADGSVLDGWPRTFPAVWHSMSTSALVDLDEDGIDEIVFVRWFSDSPNETAVHLMDASGADLPGWPVPLPWGTYCSPTVGDLDDDGEWEIAVTVSNGEVYVLSTDGSVEPGWPYDVGASPTHGSPPYGQLDADPALELAMVEGSDEFHVFNHDGTYLPGWPVDVSNIHVITNTLLPSPVFADLDGDGGNDILICGTTGSKLWAFAADGSMLDGWPRDIPGHGSYGVNNCTAIVTDLDGNGDAEVLCAGGDGYLYVWDLASAYEERPDAWTSLHHDLHNSRNQERPPLPASVGGDGRTLLTGSGHGATLSPNPCRRTLSILLDPGADVTDISRVSVYDMRGALVAVPYAGGGRNRGLASVRWDGRDLQRRAVPNGVYMVRVEQSHRNINLKAVVLR